MYEEDGFTKELLDQVNEVKVVKRGSLKDYKSKSGADRIRVHWKAVVS